MRVKAENLSYTYSAKSKSLSVKALKDVTLTIEEGEIFAIIGHTGSGKSTFVQHLNGLIKGTEKEGKLTVGEFDLREKKCDFSKLRAKAGMVFQYPEHQLFAETVKEDVGFAAKNFFPNDNPELRKEKIKTAISTVGLNYAEIANVSPFELSGGQKRRVAIAGVIVAKPELLILDEPIVGLDPKGRKEFLELLKKLHRDFAKTVVIVTHDMNIVADFCDRAAIFKDGKLFAVGTPDQLFSDEKKIAEAGLELPVTAYLKNALGEDFSVNDLTTEGFIESAAKYFGGER